MLESGARAFCAMGRWENISEPTTDEPSPIEGRRQGLAKLPFGEKVRPMFPHVDGVFCDCEKHFRVVLCPLYSLRKRALVVTEAVGHVDRQPVSPCLIFDGLSFGEFQKALSEAGALWGEIGHTTVEASTEVEVVRKVKTFLKCEFSGSFKDMGSLDTP